MSDREALEQMVNAAVEFSHDADHIMSAVDELGAARALEGHVGACETLGGKLMRTDIGWDSQHCGEEWDGETWYCERAPIKVKP